MRMNAPLTAVFSGKKLSFFVSLNIELCQIQWDHGAETFSITFFFLWPSLLFFLLERTDFYTSNFAFSHQPVSELKG